MDLLKIITEPAILIITACFIWFLYGYCLWFQHRHQQAADMFRRLLSGSDAIDVVQEFTQVEAELIRERGISEVEVQLMLDLISSD